MGFNSGFKWLNATISNIVVRATLDAWNIFTPAIRYGGQDSVVGIATHYGLDGPGIESR